ncbi:uncharacterized protein LOC128556498 [Mercenaria mercenaria]|uniref:uncharacterized protein LOC128556498 n=1 Tax=Mercenaria mercenaria TaxID=6596 RepID=UPI00234ECB46|nr:uncharacterized protein LOC128556498 [Mercenaria mercenaria]
MSDHKLQKSVANNAKLNVNTDLHLKRVPVFVSDSKGRYLKAVAESKDSVHVEWFCKSGSASIDTYNWLCRNLENLRTKYHEISLYIWTGTCDFTVKEKKFISLRKSPNDGLESLKTYLLKIKELCSSAKVKLTFLQIPYYSIQLWNKAKGHPEPDQFKSDDKRLNTLIDAANEFIDSLNCALGSYSPKLNQDLVRSRKKKGQKARYSMNFNLLRDGIHPGKNLSQTWLANIRKKIIADCA